MEEEWKHKLVVESNGNVAKTISNLRIIFTHDEELSQIKFDTFCQDDFSFSKRFQNVNGGKIDEESVGKIQDYLEQTYKLRLTQSKAFEILKTHPQNEVTTLYKTLFSKKIGIMCLVSPELS